MATAIADEEQDGNGDGREGVAKRGSRAWW
jgi:hypothetical protein